jgi:TonB family protein
MKRIGPWMASAAVHAALLAAAIRATVAIPEASPSTAAPAFAEEATYSIVIQPGGGAQVGDLASGDDRRYGAPSEATADEPKLGLDPLEGVPEWKPSSDAAAALVTGRASTPPQAIPPGSGFRKGSVVRFDMPNGGGGGGMGPGEGSAAGKGTGEGRDEGIEAKPLETPQPAYPETARRSSQEGTVILKIRIDEDGRVREAGIESSSGHAVLDDAARAAVLTWRYRAATLRDRPVSSIRRVRLVFRLE